MIDTGSLQKYSLFGGLETEQMERILPYLCYQDFPAGSDVLVEGQRNDSIYFLLEGRVEVIKAGKLIVEIPEGQAFGEMELLDVMPSAATIHAPVFIRTAILTNAALYGIYCLDTAIFALLVMNLARDLSRRLRRMDDLIVARG